ncbi:hypothetical protein KKH23_07245 [Patescibacteria group bacterium]|uniref:Uncharacterized protein n=1 Tax=viral metagenome TaxID=1070528 RepID=A0A6M3X4N2_9ZZZZ|nr:hypothetical protein [Patescibacteria group bacterium]
MDYRIVEDSTGDEVSFYVEVLHQFNWTPIGIDGKGRIVLNVLYLYETYKEAQERLAIINGTLHPESTKGIKFTYLK